MDYFSLLKCGHTCHIETPSIYNNILRKLTKMHLNSDLCVLNSLLFVPPQMTEKYLKTEAIMMNQEVVCILKYFNLLINAIYT